MRSDQDPPVFSQLFKLSIILVLVAVLITIGHNYSWSWLGNIGLYAIPIAILLASIVFYVPVVLVSHRWLKLSSFYQLMEQLHVLTRELTWPQIVVLASCAGLGEELLFRGFAQSWLTQYTGVLLAIFISSIVFALLHAMTLYYFVFALLISITFGLLLHFTESMLLIVLFHAVYDVIALGVIAKYPQWLGLNIDTSSQYNDRNLSA